MMLSGLGSVSYCDRALAESGLRASLKPQRFCCAWVARCAIQIELAGEPFTFSEVDVASAIRGLRLALGKAPETMAQLIGCSSAGYEKWERGTAAPSAQWLLRILQLCPDEEARNAFRIRSERRSKPRPRANESAADGSPTSIAPATHSECRDLAHRSIDLLHASAEAGDEAAGARLRWFAQNLKGAADYFSTRQE
jgi:transcriptional regulator with XRE-family HTH domain